MNTRILMQWLYTKKNLKTIVYCVKIYIYTNTANIRPQADVRMCLLFYTVHRNIDLKCYLSIQIENVLNSYNSSISEMLIF